MVIKRWFNIKLRTPHTSSITTKPKMDLNKPNPSRLELLPQDLLGDIIGRVAEASGPDYVNAIMSCKELALTRLDERVAKRINLHPLKKKPINALRYNKLMEKCLKENNTDASYIQGVNMYFVFKDKLEGLLHLKAAADAGSDEGTYLYALLLLGSGQIAEGKEYLKKINCGHDNIRANNAWEAIKVSIRRFRYQRNKGFITQMVRVQPDFPCEHAFLSNTCEQCLEYTALFKFNRWCKMI